MEKTVCELFAGVGGFRLGLEKASPDWKTVWFSQWEPGKKNQWAHECYVSHWGEIDEKTGLDIAEVDKREIPRHTLLVGGFPCQNYSVAASKSSKGIEGEKGVLWWQIRDTLIAKRPPFVLLENVDRLLKSPASQRGRDFGVMLTCMAQLGYRVEWRVINAAEYGAAQRRRRVFLFAYAGGTRYAAGMDGEDPLAIIRDSGFFARSFPVDQAGEVRSSQVPCHGLDGADGRAMQERGEALPCFGQADQDLLDVSGHYRFQFENAGYMADGKISTCQVEPRLEPPVLLGQIVTPVEDGRYYIPEEKLEKWRYLKGAKRIRRMSKSGHPYVFSEGPIAFPDPLDRPSRTMLTSESSLNRSTHIIEDPGTGRLRILTPMEAERLQGFDDGWTDKGMPERFRYFCMGNALVVPMITRMGRLLGTIIDEE